MSMNGSRDPLLYIMQPDIKFPKANMQNTFVVTKPPVKQKPLLNDEAKEKFDSQKEEQVLVETKAVNADEKKISVEKELQSPENKVSEGLEKEEVQEIIEQYHQDQSIQEENSSRSQTKRNQKSYSFTQVKSFKDMEIQEKLNYLENFPKQLPPVPCIFTTENSSIKGFLVQSTDDMIEIKQFNNKKVELSSNDLIDIRMLGLK